jgi:UDP-N-acetylglucosamine acyltransferase
MNQTIHATALVDQSARLGEGVVVGPYAVIEKDTDIGAGTVIGPHVVVYAHTRIGKACRVHAGAVIGDAPQDLAYEGAETFLEIGDSCTIREGVTLHRGTKPGTCTRVGNHCFLMANSHVAHNVTLGDGVILANGVLLGGYVEVGDRAFISGNAVVHQFCRVGRVAMISGCAGLSKDLPPFCVMHGAAINRISGLNVVGMRRAGLSSDDRLAVKRAFAMLFRSGLNTRQAVEQMREAFPSGPAAELWQFAEHAQRGICVMGTEA